MYDRNILYDPYKISFVELDKRDYPLYKFKLYRKKGDNKKFLGIKTPFKYKDDIYLDVSSYYPIISEYWTKSKILEIFEDSSRIEYKDDEILIKEKYVTLKISFSHETLKLNFNTIEEAINKFNKLKNENQYLKLLIV